jgi:hypothetical protein
MSKINFPVTVEIKGLPFINDLGELVSDMVRDDRIPDSVKRDYANRYDELCEKHGFVEGE